MSTEPCIFCNIVVGTAPAQIVERWLDATAFVPFNPVTPGHVLVVPHRHLRDVSDSPGHAAWAFALASTIAGQHDAANIITSRGEAATQTVFHAHVHVVPRHHGDGLALPWTGQGGDR